MRLLRKDRKNARGLILMYHQIATLKTDTWQLAVSEEHFLQQAEVLKKWNTVTVAEMVMLIQNDKLPDKTIALSFDDGYKSNFTRAIPILQHFEIPASFYLTGFTEESNHMFWWDELEQLMLLTNSNPAEIRIKIDSFEKSWRIEQQSWEEILDPANLQKILSWLPWTVPPSPIHALFVWMCDFFKTLSFDNQESLIQQLRQQLQISVLTRENYGLLNLLEIAEIGRSTLFEIGGHTNQHEALANFDKLVQKTSVERNKTILEGKLNKKISGLAYPHGSFNPETINIVEDLGFSYALTTNEGIVDNKSDRFRLPRIHVKDCPPHLFENMLARFFK